MRCIVAVLFLLSACAPIDAIRHGRMPDSGCLVLPKGKLAHQDASQWEVRLNIRCTLGSGVESK